MASQSTHLKKQTSLTSPTSDNIFGISNGVSSSTANPPPSSQNDLFGLDLTTPGPVNPPGSTNGSGSAASNDLMMLSGPNPFIQNIVNQSYSQQNMAGLAAMGAPNPFGQPNGMMMQQPINNFAMNPMQQNNNKLSKFAFLGKNLQFSAQLILFYIS